MGAPLYRETTDYVWALTRQIDRVAEAASSIDAAGAGEGCGGARAVLSGAL